MRYVVGLDAGLTVTKAVVFDETGAPVGNSSVRVATFSRRERWVERDGEELWLAASRSIASAIAAAGVRAADVAAIGVTGHGDGIYLVDAAGRPTRAAVTSLDTRAQRVIDRWRQDGALPAMLDATGQLPFAASPAAVIRWMQDEEPAALAASRWALSCKDYITMRLTGLAGTDFTEASESFTDRHSQDYDDRLLDLYGLREFGHLRPPICAPDEVVGAVTAAASDLTGLPAGTAVVAGVHDVDASAMGSGAIRAGQLVMVAGSYSINEVFADRPTIDERWFIRNAPVHGRWVAMSISPTSTTTLEWFLRSSGLRVTETDHLAGRTVYDLVRESYESVRDDVNAPLFVPYVYGSPSDVRSDGAFLDLQSWHRGDHLVRAVLEGITFTHRHHVDALRSQLAVDQIRLTGGAARAPQWAQLFADTLGAPVESVQTTETGALGVALCALSGVGVFPGLDSAVGSIQTEVVRHEPDPARTRFLQQRYERFEQFNRALDSVGRPTGEGVVT